MGVIETEEAAKRLARVIVSDIEIYNKDKFHTGADITAAIEEGAALFRSRVAPELVPLFTTVLEDRRASRKQAASAPAAAEPAPKRSAEPAPAKPAPRAVERVAPEPIVQTAPPAAEAPAPILAHAPVPAAPIVEAAAPAPAALAPTPAPAPAPAARAPSARGGIIDTEEAAARLARVILSDIELYNAKKIAAGLDLTAEIDEGRALFKSRVSGELLPVFENALASKNLGKRKRAPTPAPVVKAKPPVVETPQPAPAAPAAAPTPARPAAAGPMRPQVSAVNAPPAPQPRPGLAPAARPAGAPHAVNDVPSARHQIHASAAPATPAPVADRGSARHAAPPPGRVAPVSRTPDLSHDDEDLPTPMPGMPDEIAAEPIAASAPAAPRVSAPRLPATPPPVPVRASVPAMRAAGAAPSPPQRTRTPSVPEFAVHIESGPIRHEERPAGRPSQAVIDALPDSGPVHAAPAPVPLPPPPAPAPVAVAEAAPPAPAAQPAPAAEPARAPRAPREPTPVSLPTAPPIAFAPVPSEGEEQAVSLKRGVSPARVFVTLAALAGAGGAIWYFLLR
jgi:hypothetical protein